MGSIPVRVTKKCGLRLQAVFFALFFREFERMAPVLFGTGAESIDRKDLLAQQRLGLGYDIVGAEAEGLQ